MVLFNVLMLLLFLVYIYLISNYKMEFIKSFNDHIKKHSKYILIFYSLITFIFICVSIYETQNELAFTFNFIPLVLVYLGLLLKRYDALNVSFLFTPVMLFSFLNTFSVYDVTNLLKSLLILITLVISINHAISNQRLISKNYIVFSHFVILGTSVLFLTTFYMAKTNVLYLGKPQKNLLFIFELLNESFVAYSLLFIFIICKSLDIFRKQFNKILIKLTPESLEEVPEEKVIYY